VTTILGLSAFYHDSAAALLVDGELIAAAQEERFTRIRHDSSFPHHAVRFALEEAGLDGADLDHVVFYDKPFLKFERLLETYVTNAPRGFRSFRKAMPVWLRDKLFLKRLIMKHLTRSAEGFDDPDRLLFSEHHYSHAASAFHPSPFDEAVVLTLDGVGEWATSSVAIGRGSDLELVREIRFPHSLGLLYSAFTQYAGFRVNSGEYKLMGLAPYGEPIHTDLILDHLIDLRDDGSFRLDQRFFDYATGLRMIDRSFEELFGRSARDPDADAIEPFHMDIAASIQAVTEQVLLTLTRSLSEEFGLPNLCMAGGVALNCVANGKVLRDASFEEIWIQPAAGDAGGAVGAAYAAYHRELGHRRRPVRTDGMKGSLLGPRYTQADIESRLDELDASYRVGSDADLLDIVADSLANGRIVGWFQGRMEFGPRALGNRSILADPRPIEMQRRLNLSIKFREGFRPFAPAVPVELVHQWFDLSRPSPYMLFVADVHESRIDRSVNAESSQHSLDGLNRPRSTIPAVTHVDRSARVQTVDPGTNPRFHELLTRFGKITGTPVLANTSFNVRGEPIVASPEDAFRCFMGSGLDLLAIGNCILEKQDQSAEVALDHRTRFEPD